MTARTLEAAAYLNRWKLSRLHRRGQDCVLAGDLDGSLVDYAAKGTKIDLDGVEKVENRDNYKVKLIWKNGDMIHVWIDAQTFLETKLKGSPRLDGVEHPVEVYFAITDR